MTSIVLQVCWEKDEVTFSKEEHFVSVAPLTVWQLACLGLDARVKFVRMLQGITVKKVHVLSSFSRWLDEVREMISVMMLHVGSCYRR